MTEKLKTHLHKVLAAIESSADVNGFKCAFLGEVGDMCVGVLVGFLKLFVVMVLKLALILQTL